MTAPPTSHLLALDDNWVRPVSTLPPEVEMVLRKLNMRRTKNSDGFYAERLASLFESYGMPIRAVHRAVDLEHGDRGDWPRDPLRVKGYAVSKGYLSVTGLALFGLEIEGVVHGLRGGQGWEEILDIVRVREARDNSIDYYRRPLKCTWHSVKPLQPRKPDEKMTRTVQEVMAQAQGAALDRSTPGITQQRARPRF